MDWNILENWKYALQAMNFKLTQEYKDVRKVVMKSLEDKI